jgi:Raf kinase inhibitor-like YbhB/YbcL family protein
MMRVQPIRVTSKSFEPGASIPSVNTCDGANVSPELSWGEVPPGTKSIAVICSDPDAPGGNFIHWVIYNLPPAIRSLPPKFSKAESFPDGTKQGMNNFGKIGYWGPCPPQGTHRYHFTVYALTVSGLPGGLRGMALMAAIRGRVLTTGDLMGTYTRGMRTR